MPRARIPEPPSIVRGPERWLIPFLEQRYTLLAPKPATSAENAEAAEGDRRRRQDAETARRLRARQAGTREYPLDRFESALQPGRGPEVLAAPARTFWQDTTSAYRQRQAHARQLRQTRPGTHVRFDSAPPPA